MSALVARIRAGHCPTREELFHLAESLPLAALCALASELRDQGHGERISHSRKVFVPLTRYCRNLCHYCTFSRPPRKQGRFYLRPEEVIEIVRKGEAAGCRETLFTLGDKPELRFDAARRELEDLGYPDTFSYLEAVAGQVLRDSSLLPHINAGVMDSDMLERMRRVSVSQGLMLESISERLLKPGGVHYRSPDKVPAVRLEMIEAAGRLGIPFTSGILIGIGETRAERLEAVLALRQLHERHGHLQELIIQNFRAKAGTPMQDSPEPDLDDLCWTVAMARIAFGPAANIQCPPNLNAGHLIALVNAGINDWGGVSPVTPDHVNPEAAWPHLNSLAAETARAGKCLVERLAVYPVYAVNAERWIEPALHRSLFRHMDAEGLARSDDWTAGLSASPPRPVIHLPVRSRALNNVLHKARAGDALSEADILTLLASRGSMVDQVLETADELRQKMCGDTVTFVRNRNINYTNICSFKCRFCAFSKGRTSARLRGKPYNLDSAAVVQLAREAWERGATEVCLQGGIHPDYTGETYLEICTAIHEALPELHIHAFSPLEIAHGASTLKLPVPRYLEELKAAGLASLPGTAAEILDDEVRAVLCPDKIRTAEWLDIVKAAHWVGLRTTATIMFGHLERPIHWTRHLIRLRELQAETGGITEFVPLPFVHMESPMFLRGLSRPGPTYREAALMHATARLALLPWIINIQASWVKMGVRGAVAMLAAGANDLGGTLMNESISRAAGASHGQELDVTSVAGELLKSGRILQQRSTLYQLIPPSSPARDRMCADYAASIRLLS